MQNGTQVQIGNVLAGDYQLWSSPVYFDGSNKVIKKSYLF